MTLMSVKSQYGSCKGTCSWRIKSYLSPWEWFSFGL